MPKEYLVTIVEKEVHELIVEADNEDAAEIKAWTLHLKGEANYTMDFCTENTMVEEVQQNEKLQQ